MSKLLKNVVTMMAMVLVICIGNQVEAKEFNFRNTYWGMSQKQVQKLENGVLINSGKASGLDRLVFRNQISGLGTMNIAYEFVDNKLVSGSYMCLVFSLDTNIACLEKLAGILMSKYGPTELRVVLADGTVKNSDFLDPLSSTEFAHGLITRKFHLCMFWTLPSTTITLYTRGNGIMIDTGVDYITTNKRLLSKARAMVQNHNQPKGNF